MKELVEKITQSAVDMLTDMAKSVDGNKAAGVRARRASLELEKLLKEYRKVSLEASKK